jgi:uncharacterized membrane protein YgdD (TMEM256/DUF423 family)
VNITAKLFLTLGSISGALAVIIGAFGAHGLKDKLCAEMLSIYQTGVEYHFYHTFVLLGIGLLALHYESKLLIISGGSMAIGILLFSGSLYALSISGIKVLGAITPLGGLFFIIGWILLAAAVLKSAA